MGQNEDKKRTVDARIDKLRERLRRVVGPQHLAPSNGLAPIIAGILDLLSDELR